MTHRSPPEPRNAHLPGERRRIDGLEEGSLKKKQNTTVTRLNLRTTFASKNVVLAVCARSTKTQHVTFISTRAGDGVTVIGCRAVHADADEATVRFEELIADVEAKGWERRTSSLGRVGAFAVVPDTPKRNQPVVPRVRKKKATKKP